MISYVAPRLRLHAKRGPKTLRGKYHASRNALKYSFSKSGTDHGHEQRLFEAIKSKLISESDHVMQNLDFDAITLAMIKAYRIRLEIEETVLKLMRVRALSVNLTIDPYLKHLEGLRRYERRALSRLMTLTRQHRNQAGSRFSSVMRRIAHQQRSSS